MPRMLSDLTIAALEKALSGVALRQRVIANNLANVETPGFRPQAVSFEEQLRAALQNSSAEKALAEIAAVQPRIVAVGGGPLRRDGNAVDVEQEMARLAESDLHYAALVRLLTRKLNMLKIVATEGNKP